MDALNRFKPDVALFQEYWGAYQLAAVESESYIGVSSTKKGFIYGTAIVTGGDLYDQHTVMSPHKEFLIGVQKATAIATVAGVQFASFHGYNGWPFKDPKKLYEHLIAVVLALKEGPAVIAGDFNTWTKEHLSTVSNVLGRYGFELMGSAKYDKKKTLDLFYARGVKCLKFESGWAESDHPFMLCELELKK